MGIVIRDFQGRVIGAHACPIHDPGSVAGAELVDIRISDVCSILFKILVLMELGIGDQLYA